MTLKRCSSHTSLLRVSVVTKWNSSMDVSPQHYHVDGGSSVCFCVFHHFEDDQGIIMLELHASKLFSYCCAIMLDGPQTKVVD